MTIHTQIEKNDFIKIQSYLVFKNEYIRIFIFGALLVLAYFIIQLIKKEWTWDEMTLALIIFPIYVFIFLPIKTYTDAKKIYRDTYYLKYPIVYQINEDEFSMIGNNREANYFWRNIVEIKETKNWILIQESLEYAIYIPKKYLKDYQLQTIKSIAESYNIPFIYL